MARPASTTAGSPASKASAKPLPRAPLGGASGDPVDPLAALTTDLARLIEAHRQTATSGPALVLLGGLEGALSRASTPQPEPRLSSVHRDLIEGTHELLESLDEACWHAGHLAGDLETIAGLEGSPRAFVAGASENLALLRNALLCAQSDACSLGAELTGENLRESPGQLITRLARLLERTLGYQPDPRDIHDDVRRAVDAFNAT